MEITESPSHASNELLTQKTIRSKKIVMSIKFSMADLKCHAIALIGILWNTTAMYEICSKLAKKTGRVFIVSFKIFHSLFWCFRSWFWTSKCRLGVFFRKLFRTAILQTTFEQLFLCIPRGLIEGISKARLWRLCIINTLLYLLGMVNWTIFFQVFLIRIHFIQPWTSATQHGLHDKQEEEKKSI